MQNSEIVAPAMRSLAAPNRITPGSGRRSEIASILKVATDCKRLDFDLVTAPRLTHYLFRYPAKFHPPVAHRLVREFSSPGETVLDPFCGSGTLLLAAAVEDRHAIGMDVDPVAVFVSKVKTHRFRTKHLRNTWSRLTNVLEKAARDDKEYAQLRFNDISRREYEEMIRDEDLWVPDIPNMMHWFRRYVVVDLARILHRIESAAMPESHRDFFKLMFASVIRRSSNADPIPVSGLEVTSYMKKLDEAGRLVNPFALFKNATVKGLDAVDAYVSASARSARIEVIDSDATTMSRKLRRQVDAVITSPPYHNAVDYYRRHKLEMFWLRFTETQQERLDLLPKYIGRYNVGRRDATLQRCSELGRLCHTWEERIRQVSVQRADAFVHYMVSMNDVFGQLAKVVRVGGLVVFVIGNSKWNGSELPTSELFMEITAGSFDLIDKLWYPVKNRYMSYERRNGANIAEEFVLVLRRSNR